MSSGNTNANASGSRYHHWYSYDHPELQSTNAYNVSKARDRDRKYNITTLEADGSNWGAWKHRVTRALGINGPTASGKSSKVPKPAQLTGIPA
jgi:hypothetical protein